MADVALLQRLKGPRILTARLSGAMAQTIPMSEWIDLHRYDGVQVTEPGQANARSVDNFEFDYLYLMASNGDQAEAKDWKAAASKGTSHRALLSMTRTADSLERFCSGWDASFVNRNGNSHAPLMLLLDDRAIEYGDEDIFRLLEDRKTVVYSFAPEYDFSSYQFGSSKSGIAHFRMAAPSLDKTHTLTLFRIEQIIAKLRAQACGEKEWFLSVTTCRSSTSSLLLFTAED